MRTLSINSCNFGSTGNIMRQIAETAKRAGAETLICYPRSRSNAKKQSPGDLLIGNRISRNVHLKLAQLTGLNGMFSVFSTLAFLRKVDKWQPDIIHLHNLHNCYINLPLLFRFLKRKHIAVVWTLHDCWAMTGKCPYFTMVKCGRWKTGCFHCPQRKGYPETLVDQSRFMTIVTPSQWLANIVKQSYLKGYPVRVINNGIDLNVFKPVQSGFRAKHCIPADKPILLGVAFDWGKRKGLDAFLRLAENLGDAYQIVLVGTDESTDAQLPKNIISIHRTQNQCELAEIYSAAGVFVNPTREENFPTVNMEALACGTPVITFKTGGSPEIIDETCGMVVPCDDAAALENAIRYVVQNKPFSEEHCRRRSEQFDMRDKFAEYVQLYQEIEGRM